MTFKTDADEETGGAVNAVNAAGLHEFVGMPTGATGFMINYVQIDC